MPFSRLTTSVTKPLGIKHVVDPKTIGDNIRNRRLELGLLQKQVGEMLGIPEESVCRWETNRNSPDIKHMPKIIDFLGYCPIPIDTSTVAGKIKRYRFDNGLSQEDLAKLLGINESTVFHYEKGAHRPSPFVLKRLKILSIVP